MSATAARPHATRPEAPTSRNFEPLVKRIAHRLLASVPDLSDRDRQWLKDIAREETRYQFVTLQRLCDVSRRSRRLEDREAFAALILSESTPADALPIDRAFTLETPATGAADVEQRHFELEPTPITAGRCREALERQLATTKAALEAVRQWERDYFVRVGASTR